MTDAFAPHYKAKPKRLVIVDDEIDILSVLKSGIERNMKCDVAAFSDPAEALNYFRNNWKTCDMIISDVRMPRISGFELVRRAREIKPEVKILLMTAFEINQSEFEKILPSIKIDGFIQKPGTAKSICAKIEIVLNE